MFEGVLKKIDLLEGINGYFHLDIPSKEVYGDKLIICCSLPIHAKDVVKKIKGLLSKEKTWLWQLNNYRNSATHREIPRFHYVTEGPTVEVRAGEELKPQIKLDPDTKVRVELIIAGRTFKFGDTQVYLLKDPDDPDQGRADVRIIEYCEQSLNKMKKFLEDLYSELKI